MDRKRRKAIRDSHKRGIWELNDIPVIGPVLGLLEDLATPDPEEEPIQHSGSTVPAFVKRTKFENEFYDDNSSHGQQAGRPLVSSELPTIGSTHQFKRWVYLSDCTEIGTSTNAGNSEGMIYCYNNVHNSTSYHQISYELATVDIPGISNFRNLFQEIRFDNVTLHIQWGSKAATMNGLFQTVTGEPAKHDFTCPAACLHFPKRGLAAYAETTAGRLLAQEQATYQRIPCGKDVSFSVYDNIYARIGAKSSTATNATSLIAHGTWNKLSAAGDSEATVIMDIHHLVQLRAPYVDPALALVATQIFYTVLVEIDFSCRRIY